MIGNIPFFRGAVVSNGPSYTSQSHSNKPKSRRKRIRFLVVIALILVPTTILTVLFLNPPEQPTWLLQSAKQSLETAQRAGALRYSERTYRNAETLITQGWMEMARQNGRLAPLRDYDKADSIFLLAIKTSSDAASQTRTYLNNIQALTMKDRDDLKDELNSWEEAMNGSLAKLALAGYYSSAKLSYETACKLMLAGEFEEARESMNVSRAWLKRLAETFNQFDNDLDGKQKIWRRWVQETVDDSRASGGYAIIVDKAAHKTYLIKAGKLFHTYDCDLGYNSINQKTFAGDGATPEGKYIVTLARPRGSRYYKALNINYPNDSDRKRFNENKSKGIISQRARIGDLIEIHGNGGRNKDWTEGCVALTDHDMDHIMQFVGAGTPVTIVRRSDMWP